MSEPYFVTGAQGCIGAWVVKTLVERGDCPVVFDLSADMRRLSAILSKDDVARVRLVEGDITDADVLRGAMEASGAGRVIHLAGLQVPFCRTDPGLGARVNVVGTVNVFQAAKELGVERVSYASSAAVYSWDGESAEAPDEAAACEPATHYGVYKRANEGTARVFALDDGVNSVGLRPLTVYGPGRDQGLTSDPTKAMKAAVLGRPWEIRFAGATDFQYVADTAAAFVACADGGPEGAHVFNLHGDSVAMSEVVSLIEECAGPQHAGRVTVSGDPIPIPPALDGSRIHDAVPGLPRTALADGVRATMDIFRRLHEQGRLDTRELED